MKKVTYSCDICHDEMPREQLYGCHFKNLKEFTLSTPESTDGVHICAGCVDQIRQQILTPREKAERKKLDDDAAAHAAAYP